MRGPVRIIRVLGDYQLHGSIIRRHSKKQPPIYPEHYVNVLKSFEQECELCCYSPRSMRTRMNRLRSFVDYLVDQNVSSCDKIYGIPKR